jgi:hypothetical protein
MNLRCHILIKFSCQITCAVKIPFPQPMTTDELWNIHTRLALVCFNIQLKAFLHLITYLFSRLLNSDLDWQYTGKTFTTTDNTTWHHFTLSQVNTAKHREHYTCDAGPKQTSILKKVISKPYTQLSKKYYITINRSTRDTCIVNNHCWTEMSKQDSTIRSLAHS